MNITRRSLMLGAAATVPLPLIAIVSVPWLTVAVVVVVVVAARDRSHQKPSAARTIKSRGSNNQRWLRQRRLAAGRSPAPGNGSEIRIAQSLLCTAGQSPAYLGGV